MKCNHLVADVSVEWRILIKGILKKEGLTLLWYHEKSYINSTMGSI